MTSQPANEPVNELWKSRQAPCPICGCDEFAWGTIPNVAGGTTFTCNDDSAWQRLTGYEKIKEVEYRACIGCGAIQPFLKRPLAPKAD